MNCAAFPSLRVVATALLAVCAVLPAHGFWGVADTSFVTVIANPAEAANWAAELERLNSQLAAARATLQTVGTLRAYAGDPKAAVGAFSDLREITGAVRDLSSGVQTDAGLLREWEALGESRQVSSASALLQGSGAGASMQVFGRAQARDPALYAPFARDDAATGKIRGQIAREQAARASVAAELATAWGRFKAASTESDKQAVLAEISQLQSQNQVMDTRRRAVLDDLELEEHHDRMEAGMRSRAEDEQMLAESSLLNADAQERARSAEAGRMTTLQKRPTPAPRQDYAAMRLWTTADAGGTTR